MRPVIWFSISMLTLLSGLCWLPSPRDWILLGGALFVVWVGFFLKSDKKNKILLALSVALGVAAALGFFYFHSREYQKSLSLCDGRAYDLTALVTEVNEQNDGSWQYLLKSERVSRGADLQKASFQVLVKSGEPLSIELFDRVQIKGEFFPFEGAKVPGGFDEEQYYKAKKIYLYLDGAKILYSVTARENPPFWMRLPHRIGELVKEGASLLSKENGPLMVSLLTGNKTGLDPELKKDFTKSGLSHIIAVSGMHLSYLLGAVTLILSLLRGPMALRGVLGVFLILIYMAVGEFSPSIMRAGLVYLAAFGGEALRRDYDAYTALAASAVVILAINPFSVYQAAFWLSYLSTLGILLLGPVIRRGIGKIVMPSKILRHLTYYVLSLAATTLSATIFTIPVLLLLFGRISVLGPLANVLVLPVVPAAFVGAVLMAVLQPLFLPAAKLLALAVNPLFSWMGWVADQTAKLGDLLVWGDKTYFLVLWLFIMGVCFLLYFLGKKEERAKDIKRGLICVGAFGGILILLATASYFWGPRGQPLPDGAAFRVAFLDVGQGSATFVEGRGYTLLIDCGSTSPDREAAEAAAAYIRNSGVRQIDFAALTHYHADHVNAFLPVLKEFTVKNLILPDLPDSDGEKEALLRYAEEKEIGVYLCREDQSLSLPDGMTLELYSFGEGEGGDNEDGIVYRLGSDGAGHALFTGDIEEENQIRLAKRAALQSEILAVPHHGSGGAASAAFLTAVGAKAGVISCGADNPYGHPDPTALKRLNEAGVKVWRTDRNKTVIMVLYKDRIEVTPEK